MDEIPDFRTDATKLVRLLGEYIQFLNDANEGPIGLAHVHGWRCPQTDIDRGVEYRQSITELATTCDIVLDGW